MTMQVIEHIELASAASSITFSSIPQDATDLVVLASMRSDDATNSYAIFGMQLNSVTSGYSGRVLEGSGSSANSYSRTTIAGAGTTLARIGKIPNDGATANTYGNVSITIPNYTEAQAHSYSVDIVTENNATQAYQQIFAGLCTDTNAITSLTFGCNNFGEQDFKAGTSITLYKVLAGSDGTTTVS